MPTITELPCEMIALILLNLDHLRFLTPALLACRSFYMSFKQYHDIEAAIFRRQVTPALIPYAIAVEEAAKVSRQPYLHVEDQLSQLAARLPTMPTSAVRRMARTHDVINNLVTDFAANAWAKLDRNPADGCSASSNAGVCLSSSEHFRLCRAFYRLELFWRLSCNGSGDAPSTLTEGMHTWFFLKYSPWEMEQFGSVHDFLGERFSSAAYDVIAHDVDFGEFSIDYLSPARENLWTQSRLAQGVDFIYQLMTANSYEAKKSLLDSIFSSRRVDLPQSLETATHEYPEDIINAAEGCSKDQLQSLLSSRDNDDMDNGPFEAWHAAYAGVPAGAWVMGDEYAWLRRRAYVFWDWERIQSNGLLSVFGSISESPDSTYTDQEWEEMLESFDERSKIWQKGGSGYWSKGDTSRITYD